MKQIQKYNSEQIRITVQNGSMANPTKDLGIRSKAFSIYFGIDPKNQFGHRPKGFEGMEIGLIFYIVGNRA